MVPGGITKVVTMVIFYKYLELDCKRFSDSLVFPCERSKGVMDDAKFKIIVIFWMAKPE